MGYGGNPYGPAGTGKTESVKALAVALGRPVLVFNCDGEFDVAAMGRIFQGLVQCGAWGCFDEFNRLSEGVLSAVSQHIQVIQVRAWQTYVLPGGCFNPFGPGGAAQPGPLVGVYGPQHPRAPGRSHLCDAQPCRCVCLVPLVMPLMIPLVMPTAHPGKGYGGRSKLPVNLKQLFREVAMSTPNNQHIATVTLLAEGFTTAKALGRWLMGTLCVLTKPVNMLPLLRKCVCLFDMARHLLSAQQHYDWGLRSIKAVLTTAGQLLRGAACDTSQVRKVFRYTTCRS